MTDPLRPPAEVRERQILRHARTIVRLEIKRKRATAALDVIELELNAARRLMRQLIQEETRAPAAPEDTDGSLP